MRRIGVRELKARTSDLLRDVEQGAEFVITRHGKPCAKLVPADSPERAKVVLTSMRGRYRSWPELRWEDFQEAKGIWEPNHGHA